MYYLHMCVMEYNNITNMKSIRTRSTLLTVIAIAVGITITTIISAISVANLGHSSSEQTLTLLCETGKSNLNNYFKSVEQSVNTISRLVDDHLDTIPDSEFNTKMSNHMDQARNIFKEAAANTNGVYTYYYRLDPAITKETVNQEKGFWYVKKDGVFYEHEVTDLTDDHNEAVWFYKPKETGQPLWLSPYITDNLEGDAYVISYNIPVYRHKSFIGVIGIEISYKTLGEQIKDIKAQKTGFAYIVQDSDCSIIYHPTLDILKMKEAGLPTPATPQEFIDQFKQGDHHIHYNFEGVEKHSYWLNLSNNMSVVVCVPLSEVNEIWLSLLIQIIVSAVAVIIAFGVITILYTRKITKPLKELTEAAEKINRGEYDVELTYNRQDEIGTLTNTVDRLIKHLDSYIADLNSLAYSDSLTEVQNKQAFDVALGEIQGRLYDKNNPIKFAIAIFDCDDLKQINDKYGHDKGNVYLKNSSNLIGRVFKNSKVYRIGGDEFAVILLGEDYSNRKVLKEEFLERSNEITSFAKEPWEEIHVSIGIARYDPDIDRSAEDVMIHADHLMYDHKRERKKQNK